jgi:predicted O-methyltransferase YrrM
MVHFGLWKLGLAIAETQTTEAERDCLARHAAGKRRLAEVGVWHGVTTCRLRKAMSADGVLYAIDPYPVGRLGFSTQRMIARGEVSRIVNGSVVWLRQTGVQAASSAEIAAAGPVDFLFIDGDHSYEGIRDDWTAWRSRIAPDGIVGLHDSRSTPQRTIDDAGSVRFTNEVIRRDESFEVADVVDSLTVMRRRRM